MLKTRIKLVPKFSTMSVTTTSLSDSLPSSIPKLDASGLNWAIFSVRFQDAVEAKGFWSHFDGTGSRPSAIPTITTGTDGVITTTPPSDSDVAAVDKWDKDERSAKSLLTQKIPDSTLMRIHNKRTVQERWEAIVTEYTEKGAYTQTDICGRFLESKCPDKGNVREFLDGLRVKREELDSVGVDIDEKDYRSTIISSLPFALANFASSQLAAARMFATTKTIAPDSLISLISEEFERQKTQKSRRSGKTKDEDEAMAVGSSSGKGKGKGKAKYPRGYVGIVAKRDIIRISVLNRPLINLPSKNRKRKSYRRNLIPRTPWNRILRVKLHSWRHTTQILLNLEISVMEIGLMRLPRLIAKRGTGSLKLKRINVFLLIQMMTHLKIPPFLMLRMMS